MAGVNSVWRLGQALLSSRQSLVQLGQARLALVQLGQARQTLVQLGQSRLISTTLTVEEKANKLKDDAPFQHFVKKSAEPRHFSDSLTDIKGMQEAFSNSDYTLPHPIWSREELESVTINHRKPEGFVDHIAYFTVRTMRFGFDLFSGYLVQTRLGTLDERAVLIRVIFLETVAGVPGFAAGMIRHLHSLRKMKRDHGWIHTLLEEAENERMHLLTFMALRKPGPIFRTAVILTQWLFTAGFSLAYLISPHFCHRFVGYLEEQAVVTYTDILTKMDQGHLPMWNTLQAPPIAVRYWKLPEDALMRDVILAVRADEAHHRLVNHTLGDMDLRQDNPFKPGE